MRYISLQAEEKKTLEEGLKNHPKHHVRQRFQALILSDEGWQIKSISKLLKVRTRTIYTWMNKWKKIGLVGLMIKPGSGLKPKLSIQDEELVKLVKKRLESMPEV